MIYNIPMAEFKKNFYEVLKAHIVGYEIYTNIDPIFPDETIPQQWVEIGKYTCIPDSAKASTISYRVSLVVHAYCQGQSEQVLNNMLDDIVQSATAGVNLNEYILSGFTCHSVSFDLVDADEIDYSNGKSGYHGLVRIIAHLQQKTV